MQTLETLKTKGKARFASVMDVAKDQPSDLKHWGVAAGSAVVGAVAVNAAARGMVAILAVMASPPIALTLGAVGGGYLGWSYLQKRQAAAQGADAEARLARLAAWVESAERAGLRYGLRLPGQELPPAHGDAQRREALERLALFAG